MAKYILAIDDEEVVRDAFELALAHTEYDVETAANGEEGLEMAAARKPDLIFLDLKMPGIDGVETLRRLQTCCADVPVYIVTAFYQEFFRDLKKAGEDVGALLAEMKEVSASIKLMDGELRELEGSIQQELAE